MMTDLVFLSHVYWRVLTSPGMGKGIDTYNDRTGAKPRKEWVEAEDGIWSRALNVEEGKNPLDPSIRVDIICKCSFMAVITTNITIITIPSGEHEKK